MNRYIPFGLLALGIGSGLGTIGVVNHAQNISQRVDRPQIISTAEGLRSSYEKGLGDTTKTRIDMEKTLASYEYDSAKTAYEQALARKDSTGNLTYVMGGLLGLSLICLTSGLVAGFKTRN